MFDKENNNTGCPKSPKKNICGTLGRLLFFCSFLTFVTVLTAQTNTLSGEPIQLLSHNSAHGEDQPEISVLRSQSSGIEEAEIDGNESIEMRGKEPHVFVNFLKSAIVPGWGELSMNNNSGFIFLAMEVLLWTGRYYFLEEVKLREEEAYIYALKNAGLSPGNHSDELLHKLTKYNSSGFEPGGYNEMIYIRALSLYPDDPEMQSQYIEEHGIHDESLFWSWETREQRRQFSIMRKNADHNRDYAKAVVGAIVANHLISAINSVRVTSIRRRSDNLHFGVELDRQKKTPILQAEYRF